MQLDTKSRSGSRSIDQPKNSESPGNQPRSLGKSATKIGLVVAAVMAVSSTGCRSCLDVCHWHQRGVRTHTVHYHVPMASSQVGAPVPLPSAPSISPAPMMGGSGMSEQVPMHQMDQAPGNWPGEPDVEVAPVPRDWSGAQQPPSAGSVPDGNSIDGMADVPGAIEVPDSVQPPIQPTPDSPAIEL